MFILNIEFINLVKKNRINCKIKKGMKNLLDVKLNKMFIYRP